MIGQTCTFAVHPGIADIALTIARLQVVKPGKPAIRIGKGLVRYGFQTTKPDSVLQLIAEFEFIIIHGLVPPGSV